MKTEQLIVSLVEWLRQRAKDAKTTGFVVGISGGVDSATVAALCLRALPTLGVLMPIYSDPQDHADAMTVCKTLRLPYTTVVLDGVYDLMLTALQKGGPLAESNLKPRLRMTTLYYHANRLNRLVIGTGNRSEAYVGYFTKYGDGGVDLLPIGGLVKSEVRELATALGIPQAIVNRTPSAGLWLGQTDEDEIGLPYSTLDTYLLTGQTSPEDRAKIEELHAMSKHKRLMPPIPKT